MLIQINFPIDSWFELLPFLEKLCVYIIYIELFKFNIYCFAHRRNIITYKKFIINIGIAGEKRCECKLCWTLKYPISLNFPLKTYILGERRSDLSLPTLLIVIQLDKLCLLPRSIRLHRLMHALLMQSKVQFN